MILNSTPNHGSSIFALMVWENPYLSLLEKPVNFFDLKRIVGRVEMCGKAFDPIHNAK